MKAIKTLLAAALAVSLLGATYAAPVPSNSTPAPIDLGTAENMSSNAPVTVTVALKLRNTDQLQALLESTYKAGSPNYRNFLTTPQFETQFGPSAASIARVTRHFQAADLRVTRASTTQLQVTGSATAIQSAFNVQLHIFEVPATATAASYRFRAPLGPVQLSPAIKDDVEAVVGLSTRPAYSPHLRHASSLRPPRALIPVGSAGNVNATPDTPGNWTVVDFAQYYNVQPLYHHGLDGRGTTVGIVTLASFTPSDAFLYWNSLGLHVSPKRITEVQVDGGSGAPSEASGSEETSLDVEQSGGLSPGAKLIVYEAPNTDQGFLDAFAKAVDSNRADTLSVSWGQWEYEDLLAHVIDPTNGHKSDAVRALNNVLAQAAVQGQSFYASSGDFGAFDAVEFGFSAALTVDDPAGQQFITAVGGTTLPGPMTFGISPTQTLTINIKKEQVWGWDYLIPLCTARGFDPVSCGIFPFGGGGGISAFTNRPFYQLGIPGILNTAPGQVVKDPSVSPPATIVKLPANFRGRNVPDISLNSDPETGYVIFFTSDTRGFVIDNFFGGTSFAAPQMNGVTGLFDEAMGRVGLLNYALYDLVRDNQAYGGDAAPLRDITSGDNWFFDGERGYDQGSGVGVPNVANLLRALQK